MSANQETMRTTIKAADTTKVSAVITAVEQLPKHDYYIWRAGRLSARISDGFRNLRCAVKSVDKQKAADLFAAESARQAAVFLAKDTLRSQGGRPWPPFPADTANLSRR